jgi:hypothetical protein
VDSKKIRRLNQNYPLRMEKGNPKIINLRFERMTIGIDGSGGGINKNSSAAANFHSRKYPTTAVRGK